jgi:hypothetical protein
MSLFGALAGGCYVKTLVRRRSRGRTCGPPLLVYGYNSYFGGYVVKGGWWRFWRQLVWRICHQIWWNRHQIWWCYIYIYILIIWLLGIIGHFPTATWQPMTGPRVNQTLAHVNSLYSHPAMSHVCHSTRHVLYGCHIILPRIVWIPCVLYGLPCGMFSLVHMST